MPAEIAAHGPVHLDVTDGERSLLFWRDVLGLEVLGREGSTIAVGAGSRTLLVLYPGATTPVASGHTGLYHVAVHVPDAAEFAFVLARLSSARYRHSPTEHWFSKATYLDDLDGIGVEITLETPERVRGVTLENGRPMLIDSEGIIRPGVDHLDLVETMEHLNPGDADRPLKDGTRIGHVHLHINNMEKAENFYRDCLGFENGYPMPGTGMSDVHFNGAFKHRIAYNSWRGEAASPPPSGSSGLRNFTLAYADRAGLASALSRLRTNGYKIADTSDGSMVDDPAGNGVLLTSA
ncbi:MAG: VOC family protein [Solirubrobacterales bacterium]